jgi:hypothetical protein
LTVTRRAATLAYAATAISVATILLLWGGTTNNIGSSGVLGPYTLDDSTQSIGVSFPNCSIVVVHWHITAGESAYFSVWTSPVVIPLNCTNVTPPSNVTCPPPGCMPPSYGMGAPVCIEAGENGSCSFEAAYLGYSFLLYTPYSQGTVTLVFTASYSPNSGE